MTWQEAAFETLLRILDRDRARAAQRYIELLRTLIHYFEKRHCADPDGLASEAMMRLASWRFLALIGSQPEPLSPFAVYAVPTTLSNESVFRWEKRITDVAYLAARSVLEEALRRRQKETSLEGVETVDASSAGQPETRAM